MNQPVSMRWMPGFSRVLGARQVLWQMVGADLRGRYAGSLLGIFWSLVHPLVMVLIYTLVFSQVIGARLSANGDPYAFSIYLCAALLPWHGFAEIVKRSTTVFREHAHLLHNVAFPRALLHLTVLIGGLVNTAVTTVLFLAFMVLVGHAPEPAALPVWLAIVVVHLLLASGIGLVASVANVFFKDVAQVVDIALPLLFWLTPIVYMADLLPATVRGVLRFNPLHLFARVEQGLMLDGTLPGAGEVLMMFALTAASLALGLLCYRALRTRIPDEL